MNTKYRQFLFSITWTLKLNTSNNKTIIDSIIYNKHIIRRVIFII